MTIRRFAVLFALFSAVSCSPAKHYELKGQILAVNRDKQELLVKHEEIPGYMMAMTMPYKVQSGGMLDNVGAGDLITAQLEVKDSAATITALTKTGTAPPDVPRPSPLSSSKSTATHWCPSALSRLDNQPLPAPRSSTSSPFLPGVGANRACLSMAAKVAARSRQVAACGSSAGTSGRAQ